MKNKSLLIFLASSGVALWLAILLTLFSKCSAQHQAPNLHLPSSSIWVKEKTGRYEFANPTKLAGWATMAAAGFVDGVVEGYEFDSRKSFERKWGKSPGSFWGSQSWRRAYVDGQPEKGFKPGFQKHFGAIDFYHLADDGRKFGYIIGGTTVGIGGAKINSKWWHYAADFIIGFAISGIAKREGMIWVRN